MNSLTKTTKALSIVPIAIAIALYANSAYGQWADPLLPPTNGNVDVPVNISADNQVKIGSFSASNLYSTGSTYSDEYCNLAGTECFSPDIIEYILSVLPPPPPPPGKCEVRFTSTINGSQIDTFTLVRGENAAIGAWGHCDNVINARFTRQLRYSKWGCAWNDNCEKAGLGYYTQTQYEANATSISSAVVRKRFLVQEGETATATKSACGRAATITAQVMSCVDD